MTASKKKLKQQKIAKFVFSVTIVLSLLCVIYQTLTVDQVYEVRAVKYVGQVRGHIIMCLNDVCVFVCVCVSPVCVSPAT